MTAKAECCCPECGAEFAAKPEGGHRLLCGDSTVATDVERVLGGVAPHLMVTDPPYGVNYDSRQHFPSVAACARAARRWKCWRFYPPADPLQAALRLAPLIIPMV